MKRKDLYKEWSEEECLSFLDDLLERLNITFNRNLKLVEGE